MKNQRPNGFIDIQGHRGARGVRPENTKAAFRYALEQGINTIELDTVLTADDKLVVHHDLFTNPKLCTGNKGEEIARWEIRTLKMAALRELNCGTKPDPNFPEQILSQHEKLITLKDFFQFIKDLESTESHAKSIRFNIELKFAENPESIDVEKAVQRALKVIEQVDMVSRSSVQSFHLPALVLIKRYNPDIIRAALFMPTNREALSTMIGLNGSAKEILGKATALDVDIISPHQLYVNSDFVIEAHKQKMKVVPWTVNDKERMKELLGYGVDGIITDYPATMLEALQEFQVK